MRIVTVQTHSDCVLSIVSDDGRSGFFDVSPYLEYQAFNKLRNPVEFAKIINGGYFIEWECGADLSADTIEAHWRVVSKGRQKSA